MGKHVFTPISSLKDWAQLWRGLALGRGLARSCPDGLWEGPGLPSATTWQRPRRKPRGVLSAAHIPLEEARAPAASGRLCARPPSVPCAAPSMVTPS